MSRLLRSLLLCSLVMCGGCHHARIETGATPSTVVIDESWSASWVCGLVPPKILETAGTCPSGVAKVETRLGFLNQVVGVLTLGIYTPMDVKVTCALAPPAEGGQAPTGFVIEEGATSGEIMEVFARAAEASRRLAQPVLVRF